MHLIINTPYFLSVMFIRYLIFSLLSNRSPSIKHIKIRIGLKVKYWMLLILFDYWICKSSKSLLILWNIDKLFPLTHLILSSDSEFFYNFFTWLYLFRFLTIDSFLIYSVRIESQLSSSGSTSFNAAFSFCMICFLLRRLYCWGWIIPIIAAFNDSETLRLLFLRFWRRGSQNFSI